MVVKLICSSVHVASNGQVSCLSCIITGQYSLLDRDNRFTTKLAIPLAPLWPQLHRE